MGERSEAEGTCVVWRTRIVSLYSLMLFTALKYTVYRTYRARARRTAKNVGDCAASTFNTALALALALGLTPKRRPTAPSFPRIVVEHRLSDSLTSEVNGHGRELRRASNERLHARGLGVRVSLHRLGRSGRAHPRDVGGRQAHHQALDGRVGRRRAHGAVLKLVHLRGCS